MFLTSWEYKRFTIRANSSGVTDPDSGDLLVRHSCEMSEFWQNTHLKVHPKKKTVPEGMSNVSSPIWAKALATQTFSGTPHVPTLPCVRSTPHIFSQKLQLRRYSCASRTFKSKKVGPDGNGFSSNSCNVCPAANFSRNCCLADLCIFFNSAISHTGSNWGTSTDFA